MLRSWSEPVFKQAVVAIIVVGSYASVLSAIWARASYGSGGDDPLRWERGRKRLRAQIYPTLGYTLLMGNILEPWMLQVQVLASYKQAVARSLCQPLKARFA